MKDILEEVIVVKKSLQELSISPDRLKEITIKWEKVFPDKAFPVIKIKLYE